MASILVRHNNKYRMWNTVVDGWESKLLDKPAMLDWILSNEHHNCKPSEALNWIERTGYSHRHKLWVNRYFDSQYKSLCYTARRNTRAKRKYLGKPKENEE